MICFEKVMVARSSFSYIFSPLKNLFVFCFVFDSISTNDDALSEFTYLPWSKINLIVVQEQMSLASVLGVCNGSPRLPGQLFSLW